LSVAKIDSRVYQPKIDRPERLWDSTAMGVRLALKGNRTYEVFHDGNRFNS
jgi:hypothetical protein